MSLHFLLQLVVVAKKARQPSCKMISISARITFLWLPSQLEHQFFPFLGAENPVHPPQRLFQALGRKHPRTLSSAHNLSNILRERGQYRKAVKLLEETKASLEEAMEREADGSRWIFKLILYHSFLRGNMGTIWKRSKSGIGRCSYCFRGQKVGFHQVCGVYHPRSLVAAADLKVC